MRVFPSPDAIGEHVAQLVLTRIEKARWGDKRFVLGCPTGRTPGPIYRALARHLAEKPEDLSHVVLVMMDEYLVAAGSGYKYASARNPWSCHHFARVEIADRLNASLLATQRLREESIWFPDPRDPAAGGRGLRVATCVSCIRMAHADPRDASVIQPGGSE